MRFGTAAGLAIAFTIAAKSALAGTDVDCAARQKAVNDAKDALRTCAATGGDCAAQMHDVEQALTAASGCGSSAATPALLPAADARCTDGWAKLHAAERALRDCLSAGGGCAAEFKAKEEAAQATADCPPEQTPTPTPLASPSPAPAPNRSTTAPPAGSTATPPASSIWTPQPTPPPAPIRFGTRGTYELSGGLSVSTETSKTTVDDSSTITGGSAKSTFSRVDLEPFLGYFVGDGVELTVGMIIISDTTSPSGGGGSGSAQYDFSIGGAWLAPATDTFRIGPALQVRLDTLTDHSTDAAGNSFNDHLSGPDTAVLLMLKSVVGKSGVLTASVGYDWLVTSGGVGLGGPGGSGSSTERFTSSGLFTGIGFGVWF